MNKKLILTLLGALSLFAMTQFEAKAENGVERTANTWMLTPESWHPNPSKTHENYPFDLNEGRINADSTDNDPQINAIKNHLQSNEATVSSPVYHQQP